MIEILQQLPVSVLILACAVSGYLFISSIKLVAWIFKEWWSDRKGRIENQTQALLKNTMAIQKLEIQVQALNEYLHVLPKLQRDINSAHEKIRTMVSK